ncbi:zinc finger protein 704 isoform X3 [Clarias gariepinus]|uniref:zinc finger protein 704 isoform X3 n=1 Tax=Clarias gariepinus TaxID=13013 RepID=UPI00234DAEA8|nr:zinc finger protein 704 isoform X3 [Clarias gariepinus]
MHARRLVKRSLIGSRVYAPGSGAAAGEAGEREHRDTPVPSGPTEEEAVKGARKPSLKSLCNGGQRDVPASGQNGGTLKSENTNGVEELRAPEHRRGGRTLDMEKDNTRSVSLLEQKRKVVSSSIDVPHARKSEEEVDMDKVTAAMVLTSLSTSPLVRSPPVKVSEGLNGSWKDGVKDGFTPSSYSSSSGFWSWSAPSDQSNPSTPSPPLSADSFRPFRMSSFSGPQDDTLDEQDTSSLLFDEPIPRKRKNSMKVMFKCLWKNCGKVLSTAAGIQRHIRTVHLGRNCDSECSDGEEDFYYTEIKLNTDSVADGLSSLSPASPSVLSPPPAAEHRRSETSSSTSGAKSESSSFTPLSRSAPSALYLVHTDHAYQASPTHSQTQGFSEQRSQTIPVLSSLPRASGSLSRKSRGEGKKCRKVYGMENRDMWCTACRWKKACQRFVD